MPHTMYTAMSSQPVDFGENPIQTDFNSMSCDDDNNVERIFSLVAFREEEKRNVCAALTV